MHEMESTNARRAIKITTRPDAEHVSLKVLFRGLRRVRGVLVGLGPVRGSKIEGSRPRTDQVSQPQVRSHGDLCFTPRDHCG